MIIEARPYGPEASPDIELEIRKRVWKVEDRLFMLVEVPVQTPFTLDLFFDRLEQLAMGLDRFAYVVDLTGVKRPDARARERLRERVRRINPRLAHVGVVVAANSVMRAVAKLAAFAIGFGSFSFHTSVDEALEACRRALG
jgi:tryptophan synthase alpha subunit